MVLVPVFWLPVLYLLISKMDVACWQFTFGLHRAGQVIWTHSGSTSNDLISLFWEANGVRKLMQT